MLGAHSGSKRAWTTGKMGFSVPLLSLLQRSRRRGGSQATPSKHICTIEISLKRGYHCAGFHDDEIHAREGHKHPRINYYSFVEYPIEDVDEVRLISLALKSHSALSMLRIVSGGTRRGQQRRSCSLLFSAVYDRTNRLKPAALRRRHFTTEGFRKVLLELLRGGVVVH